MSMVALRATLALVGLAIALLGLDVAFGGIRTLGWMGPTDFIDVLEPADFAVQNSHVKFLGGLFVALGLGLIFGAVRYAEMRTAMLVICSAVFVGGLARLTGSEVGVVMNGAVLPSFLAEIVLFPALAFWIHHQR